MSSLLSSSSLSTHPKIYGLIASSAWKPLNPHLPLPCSTSSNQAPGYSKVKYCVCLFCRSCFILHGIINSSMDYSVKVCTSLTALKTVFIWEGKYLYLMNPQVFQIEWVLEQNAQHKFLPFLQKNSLSAGWGVELTLTCSLQHTPDGYLIIACKWNSPAGESYHKTS